MSCAPRRVSEAQPWQGTQLPPPQSRAVRCALAHCRTPPSVRGIGGPSPPCPLLPMPPAAAKFRGEEEDGAAPAAPAAEQPRQKKRQRTKK